VTPFVTPFVTPGWLNMAAPSADVVMSGRWHPTHLAGSGHERRWAVLRGDLADSAAAAVLARLAADSATGCLHVETSRSPHSAHARADAGAAIAVTLYLRSGRLAAGERIGGPLQVGARLVAAGVAPDHLAEAAAAQAGSLAGWRLEEVLAHLGYVDRGAVEALAREQLLDAVSAVVGATAGSWHFRRGERTRAMLALPVEVPAALAQVEERRAEALALADVLGPEPVVPRLTQAAAGASDHVLGPLDAALLQAVGGGRDLGELARVCGLSLLEAQRATAGLVEAGLVEAGLVEAGLVEAGLVEVAAAPVAAGPAPPPAVPAFGRLPGRDHAVVAAALAELAASSPHPAVAAAPRPAARAEEPARGARDNAGRHTGGAGGAAVAGGEAGAAPAAGAVSARDPQADTASLLRELSSLGVDDARPAAAPVAPRLPVTSAIERDRKRKGLFGRG